jgi:hypothetical protein
LYVWRNGKHIKRYVGKTLPQSAARDTDGQIARELPDQDSARRLPPAIQ